VEFIVIKSEVFVSVRNEQDSIVGFCHELLSECKKYGIHQVSIIDNASNDRTREKILKNFTPDEIRIFTLERNLGYTGSINAAITMSTADFVVILDGDGQFPAKFVGRFIDAARFDADLVFAERNFLIGGMIRKFASRILFYLCKIILGFQGKDLNGGIRSFNRSFLDAYKEIPPFRRLANPALFYQAKMSNLRIGFVEVSPVPRIGGESFIPWHNPFMLFFQSWLELIAIKNSWSING